MDELDPDELLDEVPQESVETGTVLDPDALPFIEYPVDLEVEGFAGVEEGEE